MIYTAVLSGGMLVGDYTNEEGDFSDILLSIHRKNKQKIEFYSVSNDGFEFFFLNYNQFVFSAICEEGFNKDKVYSFLEKVKEHFLSAIAVNKDNQTRTAAQILTKLANSKTEEILDKIENDVETIKVERLKLLDDTIQRDHSLSNLEEKSTKLNHTMIDLNYKIKTHLKKGFFAKNKGLLAFGMGALLIFALLIIINK